VLVIVSNSQSVTQYNMVLFITNSSTGTPSEPSISVMYIFERAHFMNNPNRSDESQHSPKRDTLLWVYPRVLAAYRERIDKLDTPIDICHSFPMRWRPSFC
jgi:hypothetical protein